MIGILYFLYSCELHFRNQYLKVRVVRGGGRGEYIQWRKGSKQAQVNVCGVAYFVWDRLWSFCNKLTMVYEGGFSIICTGQK